MRGLKGKLAVVIGAGGGIGRALTQRFCEEGARVVAADINADALDRLSPDCTATLTNWSR